MKWLLGLSISGCVVLLTVALLSPADARLQSGTELQRSPEVVSQDMPRPRDLAMEERRELRRLLSTRFKIAVPEYVTPRAAGAFRFIGTKDSFYADRTDVGSVAFETGRFGVNKGLSLRQTNKDVLLSRIEVALRQAGLNVRDKQFAQFQDEFAGAAQPRELPANFDPRRASQHVARTAVFKRAVEGIPFFNSELLVGLNPDGTIGRLRRHWPQVEPAVMREAHELKQSVASGKWRMPDIMSEKGVKILEVTAGVGHSGFADPKFQVRAVVRVLFRKTVEGTEYPISSTGYKYFDASGREVKFSAFPAIPGTSLEKKNRQNEK